jgi:hypothetical protein
MNQALELYKSEPRIFSVSGFNFGLNGTWYYPYDAFCFYRSSSWGWGTWKNRWELADWSISDYDNFCTDKERQLQFNRGGDDLSHMLALQMQGKIDSWAIRWAYTHFTQDALALLSFQPRVFNIGSGSSATHTRRKLVKQSPLTTERKSAFRYPETARLDERFVLELQKALHPSLARRLVRTLLRGRIGLTMKQIDSERYLRAKTENSTVPETNRRSIFD